MAHTQYTHTIKQEIKKDDFHKNGVRPSSTIGGISLRRRSDFIVEVSMVTGRIVQEFGII